MRALYSILILAAAGVLFSCEEVITVELQPGEPRIVIEGNIENDLPPIVFMSRSFPFFGDVNINDVEALMIRGANIVIANTTAVVPLIEYDKQTLEALPPADFELIAPLLEQYLGFEVSQELISSPLIPDIPFYSVSPADLDFLGEIGRNYWITVNLFNDPVFGTVELSGKTFIPFPVDLDSLWVEDHPLEEFEDSLFQLRTRLDDPDTAGNFYRLFAKTGSGTWLTSSNSVFDDAFLAGESVPFTVQKGQSEQEKLEDPDIDRDGYWEPGDSATIKLCMIVEDHYDFWRTVENEKNNLGNAFGSFSIIATTIDGAVGVWGGYACTTISKVIPDQL